jgi:type 1 glutamine amidotransferase
MSGNLVLSGGPGHDFDGTTAELGALSTDAGLTPTVITEPDEFFAALREAERGELAPWDLVTVNALRWRMETGRYGHQRDDLAFQLDPADAELLATHVTGGGGLLVLHTGVICFDAEPAWHRLVGGAWRWGSSSHPPVADVDVTITDAGRHHPVTAGLEPFRVCDELYRDLDTLDDIVPLLDASHEGLTYPLLWARAVGGGRVVTDVLGHGTASFRNPAHRAVLGQAMSWARRRPADDR